MVAVAFWALFLAWSVERFTGGFGFGPSPSTAIVALAALAVPGVRIFGLRALVVFAPALWVAVCAGRVADDRLAPALEGRDIVVTGIVCSLPDTTRRPFRFRFDLEKPAPGVPARVYLGAYGNLPDLRPGDRWRLEVRLRRPRGLSNPGGFDFADWARSRGFAATGYVRGSPRNALLSRAAGCPLTRLRGDVAARIVAAAGGQPTLPYLLALSVGLRSGLGDRDWGLLRRTGTVHLLAISGLHVGLLAGFGWAVGRVLGAAGAAGAAAGFALRPLAIGRFCAAGAAIGYAALAGFTVPTVRALVMTGIVLVLAQLRRASPPFFGLAAALFVVLSVEPFATAAPGFWLSFIAVGLLLLGTAAFEPRMAAMPLKRLRSRVAATLRAQWRLCLGLAPLVALFYGEVSLIALLANLVAVPFFAVFVIPPLLFGTFLLALSPVAGGLLVALSALSLDGVLKALAWLDRWPWSSFSVPGLTPMQIALLFAASLVLVWPRPLPGRSVGVMVPVVVVAALTLWTPRPELRLVVLDVGQGLAAFVQTKNHTLVYDGGPRYANGDAGRSVVLPALRQFGVRRLDRMVVSHGDNDHAGGAQSVIDAFAGVSLFGPADWVAGRRGRACRAGDAWTWDGVEFRFLHPPHAGGGPHSENDASCVLLVRSPWGSLLLPGDIERAGERTVARGWPAGPVDVVIAPHHGSASSSTHRFIAVTSPRFVVFPVGFANRWGFPRPEVVARWVSADACVLTTARDGALIFESWGGDRLRLTERHRPAARPFGYRVLPPGCAPAKPVIPPDRRL